MCPRVQTKPDRGTLQNPPRCWDFLVSKFNSGGRARRYGDAAAAARRIGKTGGIALVTRPRGRKGSLGDGDDFPPDTVRFRHLAMGRCYTLSGNAALRPCGALEADVPVVRVHLFSGVVRVGHDAYRTRQRRLLAEGALVVFVDVAHFFPPLAGTVVAAFGNDHLDAGGVLVGDNGAHRRPVLPDVHQRRVGHIVCRLLLEKKDFEMAATETITSIILIKL